MGTYLTYSLYNIISSSLGKGSEQGTRSLTITKDIPINFKMSSYKCTGDDDCMNMDSYRSSPGKDPVYSCPAAKCTGNTCICGSDCKLDPYLGICCQDLEVINKDVFCVEDRNSVLKVKNDDLAHDNILDSDGNSWDYISSPNSALKKKIANRYSGALGALSSSDAGKMMRQEIFRAKKEQVSKKLSEGGICNVPDQLIYNKNKTKYIIVPGTTICNIYKKYQE